MLVEIDLVAIAQFGGSGEMLDLRFFCRNNRSGLAKLTLLVPLALCQFATNFDFVESDLLAVAGSSPDDHSAPVVAGLVALLALTACCRF